MSKNLCKHIRTKKKSRLDQDIIFFSTISILALGPLSLPLNGYRDFFPEGYRGWGREVDHSPPPSAEIKNERNYVSHICLRNVDTDSFDFTIMT